MGEVLIKPGEIPGTDINTGEIAEHGKTISSAGDQVRSNGSQVVSQWQGLRGVSAL